jgi:hypothetical protein
MNQEQSSQNHPHPLTHDHHTNTNSNANQNESPNSNTLQSEHHQYHQYHEYHPIVNMNDNTIYDGYSILEQNVSTTTQNQNNVFSYLDLYPEPLINFDNNTFIDNNDPELENVYVMLHDNNNINNITNINNININNTNNMNTIHNNVPDIIAEQLDLNTMTLPRPQLTRSYNM